MIYILSHIGAAVALEAILEASGIKVFSQDDTGLVNVTNYKFRLIRYVVLLDYLSKALVNKGTSLSISDLRVTEYLTKLWNYVNPQPVAKEEAEATVILQEVTNKGN
jgi:hypothetical protein